ncbi:nuclear transport factor 2 family protein [Streptomyces sp. NPDC057148]|uniref:nuclear transport factor 2 family protein n=1 Tax=unclassified Streptomyces TaxID=2593676 RepID=UPI00363BDD12
MHDTQGFVKEYFASATGPDRERYLSLFGEDVAVHDDGHCVRGLAEVRRWREETPDVHYGVREVTGTPTGLEAVAEVSGDFPGSPVTLRFAFERDAQGKITALTIAP